MKYSTRTNAQQVRGRHRTLDTAASSAFWIYGKHPVLESMRARPADVQRVLVTAHAAQSSFGEALREACGAINCDLEIVDARQLKHVAGTEHDQGVTAQLSKPPVTEFKELCHRLDRQESDKAAPLLLVIDEIQDPQNMGSLIRNAEAAGADGVIFAQPRNSGITPSVVRASAGAIFHIPVSPVPNLAAALRKLQLLGLWVMVLDSAATKPLYAVDLTVPIAIVVGNEGKGVRVLTSTTADIIASIPMGGQVSSLNVSAAGAVALFETTRQRLAQATSRV